MKILWITNVVLPEANELLNEPINPFGGWLVNASKDLALIEEVDLVVASPKSNIDTIKKLSGKHKSYYLFPWRNQHSINDSNFLSKLQKMILEINPDLVHIFGTEFSHSLAIIKICEELSINCVISIQGLVSIIAKHYSANLPSFVQKRYTFRDLVKKDNIKQQQKRFFERGILEIEAIKKINHIIGRTTWDKVCTYNINSKAKYYFCNETLREEFYNHKWEIDRCEKYSIFISQGSYPIKGLHYVLEAMRFILQKYPESKLFISGPNIVMSDSIKDKIKMSSYGKYIKELIHKYDLKKNIFFTGQLDEKQMCQRFLKSHVFLSASTIENESNSLSEAKILGVPSVSSYVGGVIDRIQHNIDGFHYQHDAPYMLAYYVCKIFENNDIALRFSKSARESALKTHNRDENTRRLIEIYKEIIGK